MIRIFGIDCSSVVDPSAVRTIPNMGHVSRKKSYRLEKYDSNGNLMDQHNGAEHFPKKTILSDHFVYNLIFDRERRRHKVVSPNSMFTKALLYSVKILSFLITMAI